MFYPRKNCTPTIHKILFHSPAVVSYFNEFNLPIVDRSEEALESRNKDIRNVREFYARNNSRIKNITDIFNHLMVTSDPFLDQFRYRPKVVSTQSYSPEVLDLLKQGRDIPMDVDDSD